MTSLKQIALTLVLLLTLTFGAKATWSIIIIDPKTKEIGIAGASCTFSVYGIGAIVPGKGALVVQAMSNGAARDKGVQMILSGASPAEVLKAMMDPSFDPEEQQYGIVCLNHLDTPQTYSGSATTTEKGTLTSKGVSIQGNTLSNLDMLQKIMEAVIKGQQDGLSIQEILMLAMEAGSKYGGDKRCGDRKALSAFLTVAKPGDDPKHPYINLIVNQTGENINAVEALRKRFDKWRSK